MTTSAYLYGKFLGFAQAKAGHFLGMEVERAADGFKLKKSKIPLDPAYLQQKEEFGIKKKNCADLRGQSKQAPSSQQDWEEIRKEIIDVLSAWEDVGRNSYEAVAEPADQDVAWRNRSSTGARRGRVMGDDEDQIIEESGVERVMGRQSKIKFILLLTLYWCSLVYD